MTYNSWGNWLYDLKDEDLKFAYETIEFLEGRIYHFKSSNKDGKYNERIRRLELSITAIKYFYSMK